jgi:ParB family chromosome partitioning protein
VAGLVEIEARVHEMLSDKSMMEWAIIENVQRVDLNAIEVGLSYQQLIEHHGYTHEVIADRVGKSRSAITNSLRLLKLPDSVQGWIAEGKISAGAARTLLSANVQDPESEARKLIEGGLSVRQAENQQKEKKAPKQKVTPVMDPNLARIVEDFQYALGTKVTLQAKSKDSSKGTLVVEYESWEDLDRLRNLVAGRA